MIMRPGQPLLLPANPLFIWASLFGVTIFGEGPRSILRFRRARSPSFYGVAVEGRGVRFRDLALEVDRDRGGSWVAAVAVTAPAADLLFERVIFRGRGGREGLYGLMTLSADIAGLTLRWVMHAPPPD